MYWNFKTVVTQDFTAWKILRQFRVLYHVMQWNSSNVLWVSEYLWMRLGLGDKYWKSWLKLNSTQNSEIILLCCCMLFLHNCYKAINLTPHINTCPTPTQFCSNYVWTYVWMYVHKYIYFYSISCICSVYMYVHRKCPPC